LVYGTDGNTATMTIRRADDTTSAAQIFGSKARGTMASPTTIQSGDRLLAIAGGGWNGTAWSDTQALFAFGATQTWTNSAMGSSFTIGLTPDGSTSRADVFSITNSGSTGVVSVLATTTSTSTATGAFKVAGGAGIAGATYTATLNVGSGTTIDGVWSNSASLDFLSVSGTGGTQDLTITVTGASTGDTVAIGLPTAPNAGLVFNAWVSAANTVTVRATNATAVGIDPSPATFRVTVFSH
jgi:hypothetical protein